ncbi:unnamed protein product [Durusdinium trenchii]|uniref:Uncharacterized protein n=2 Tax=Durusdinium trenchii TaxID=1381693 RepID=A0ABP0R8K8_9DINO
MFTVASACACLAFVAHATSEWKEVFHLWEIASAGWSKPSCFVWALIFAILPKALFALGFTVLAPFVFLDADRKTELILNCTGLMFLLQVDNELFKATGGELSGSDLDALADRVQQSYFAIKDGHIKKGSSSRSEKDNFRKTYQKKRRQQRQLGFSISFVLSVIGYCFFKKYVSNSATITTLITTTTLAPFPALAPFGTPA